MVVNIADMTVTVRMEWRWEAGDGSPCLVCGEAAWLNQRRMFFTQSGFDAQKTKIVLCGSCAEIVDQQ